MSEKYKVEIFAEWVIPATEKAWESGYYGMCTNCGNVNGRLGVAPKYCEKCGATMTNATMK